MAQTGTLGEGWTLRDDRGGRSVFGPLMIGAIKGVWEALADQGLINPEPVGLEALRDEWVYTRDWVYETSFDWSGADERLTILCQRVCGLKDLQLNGRRYETKADALDLDLTEALQEGENRLEIRVQGTDPGLGISAPVRLRRGNYMNLLSFACVVLPQGIRVDTKIEVFTQGCYAFCYGVMLDETSFEPLRVEERLRPGIQSTSHTVELPETIPYDRARPEESCYALRLSIEKHGVGCQVICGDCARRENEPRRIAYIDPDIGEEQTQREMELARELGADGLDRGGREISLLGGFLPARGEPLRCPAFATAEEMKALAGDEPFWPPSTRGVWALTDGEVPDREQYEGLFGPEAFREPEKAARITRFWQAQCLRREALEAALAVRPCCVMLSRGRQLADSALVDASGALRPAYHALQQAWRPIALYARLPEDLRFSPGSTAKVPLFLVARDVGPRVLTLQADCLDLAGGRIAGVSLPCVTGGTDSAGELACPLPQGEALYVLQLRALDEKGGELARGEYLLAASEREHPLAQLLEQSPALADGYRVLPTGEADGYGSVRNGQP